MFQDAPIYHQLVAERGDVPARVRDAATAIHSQLEAVMRTGLPNAAFEPGPPPPGATPRPHSELLPGQHPPH